VIRELLAVIATLLLGPAVFYLLSHHRYKRLKPKFPVGVIDTYGDIIVLPISNAIIMHYGILGGLGSNLQRLFIAFVIAYILTRVFVIYRKDFAKHDDWSRPERGTFNFGGWYHAAFLFAQAFIVLFAVLHSPGILVLWFPIAAFVLLIAIRISQMKSIKTI
jgi:hypothetical protein